MIFRRQPLAFTMGIFAIAMALGCASAADFNPEKMRMYEATVIKISRAIEAEVYYNQAPKELTGDALLTKAMSHDRRLLEYFAGESLTVRRQGNNTSVLVCNKERTVGYIEDAGCTAIIDSHLWLMPERQPCKPILDLDKICSATGRK